MDLTKVSAQLFDACGGQQRSEAQTILDGAALAQNAEGARLLPWRAHVFQRALAAR
jgi:hypothetical protein